MRLNEARDLGAPLQGARSSSYDVVDVGFYRRGRYLFYRYDDGSYRDVVFSLVKATEEDDSDYATTIWFNQEKSDGSHDDIYSGGSYGDMGPADELLAYIDSLR